MDVLALLRTLGRHKIAVTGIILATLGGMAYVLMGVGPVYKQTSSIVLLQPRSQPSAADLKESKELALLDPYNPFSGDPSLIVGVVSARLSSDETRESFIDQGLDPDYEVAAAVSYGSARPELMISAFGKSPKQAISTRVALTQAVLEQLTAVQDEQGVDAYYMLRAFPVEPGSPPQEQTSAVLRSLVAVGAMGGIALFGIVSLLEALAEYRRGQRSRKSQPRRRRRTHADDEFGAPIEDSGAQPRPDSRVAAVPIAPPLPGGEPRPDAGTSPRAPERTGDLSRHAAERRDYRSFVTAD